jgi:ketosteroid isomerase-like protein
MTLTTRSILVALVVLCSNADGWSAQRQPAAGIRDLTHAVNAAYAANDLDKYFSYYADDLTQWWPSGRVSLASYRESWTKFVKSGGRVEAAVVSDLEVQLNPSGDTAIATYKLKVRTRSPKGEVTEEENQETDVWFRRNGRWQIVHLHYSPAKP